MGAVAYNPKVVTSWDGFRVWLRGRGLDFDYVLYSNYERQVEELLSGRIDAAWNSPLAWVRAKRLGHAAGVPVEALTMRDSDRDLTSVVVVGPCTGRRSDLKGRTVATGAVDSPQATLLPLSFLRGAGLTPGDDVTVRRFEVGVGLHGDHIGGERDAARALMDGDVDAACMIDGNHLAFVTEGTLGAGATRVIGRTGLYDHCNMTVGPAAAPATVDRFTSLLLGMSYDDPEVRALLDLEGLHAWRPGRTDGYTALEQAVDESGFYGSDGAIRAADIDLADLGLASGHLLICGALAGCAGRRAHGDGTPQRYTSTPLHVGGPRTPTRAQRDARSSSGAAQDDRWRITRVSSRPRFRIRRGASRGALVEAGRRPWPASSNR
jgi:ABC-type phosphate/phosphonate transport system substrate-binding protein